MLRENQKEWAILSENEKREKEEEFLRHESVAKSYLLLSNSTIELFHQLSFEIVDPFMDDLLINEISKMLNLFLSELAGPKSIDLKVKNPKKYYFDPKSLLLKITDIYVHFSSNPSFAPAVCKDKRSYKHEVFVQTAQILRKIGISVFVWIFFFFSNNFFLLFQEALVTVKKS